MLPIASFKNAGTEMILERFTLTMFHCKRQTWICTTRPSFTLTWLLQNKSCLGQFLSAPFLFWIYNCRKRDSKVLLYCSLKYYWKTNETSNENQSLVTILLRSQFFSPVQQVATKSFVPLLLHVVANCCLWFLLQFNLPWKTHHDLPYT